MLESLTIKNFGIIEATTLDLSSGLNILTGETGAGKSILIDALRFGLGERFQASHMRDGADQCLVEAVFQLDKTFLKTLNQLEDFPSEDRSLIIQRSVSSDGKNRIRINGLTATVSQLKELGDRLIDLHGPHDHQLLLAADQHQHILDALTDFGSTLKNYQDHYKILCEIKKKIAALDELSRSRERDLDLLSHQTKELEQVSLDDKALEETEQEQSRINNAEKLFENIELTLNTLENEAAPVDTLLSRAYKPLQNLADIDPKAAPYLDDLVKLQDDLQALTTNLKDYASQLNFDPSFAKEINERFDMYHDIKRKYGPTLADARAFYEDAKRKLDLLQDFEHNAEALQKDLKKAEKNLVTIATDLTKSRKKTAAFLKKTIEQELQELGFKSVLFEARMESVDFNALGADKITFFISPNAGESLKPLAEIVSSGESARIMLAIKKALMKVDPVPVLIFDEIDAQIGGRLGTTIGKKLSEISAHRQVILITHLPQIAAFATTHLKIMKITDKGRTKTVVAIVDGDERTRELAQMMAGEKITDVAFKHAQDMLKEARNKK